MKRDMELARAILLKIEADECPPGTQVVMTERTEREVAYHVALLGQAGLLTVTDCSLIDGFPQAIPIAMTNAGHDFLALAADDTLWRKAKSAVVQPLITASFDLLLTWLKAEAKARLGI